MRRIRLLFAVAHVWLTLVSAAPKNRRFFFQGEAQELPSRLPSTRNDLLSSESSTTSSKVSVYRFDDDHIENRQTSSLQSAEDSTTMAAQTSQPTATILSWRKVLPFTITDMDRSILAVCLPLSAVFAIVPLGQALNLFWINRLGEPLAVAGQAAANQVFMSAFWLFAFLPSVTATLVSQSHASGDLHATQDAVCQALLLALGISVTGTTLMFANPQKALRSILKDGSPALEIALPYLRLRAFSFVPMLLSFVGFSTMRGIMEVPTSVKITVMSSAITALLDPILIHVGNIGVRGAAMATLAGEYMAAGRYLKLLWDKGYIPLDKLFRLPAWSSILPLLRGGLALQVRSFAFNLSQLLVARVIQSINDTGVAPSAHALAIQCFQLGGILLGALGMATQTMVPNAMAKQEENKSVNDIRYGDALIRRLFQWGVSIGVGVGLVQMMCLPAILKSSPLEEVRQAARIPALIAIGLQGVNGVVNVGEGVMMGKGEFAWLAGSNVVATLGYLGALEVFPAKLGLTGVWISLAIFTTLRMGGVLAKGFLLSPKAEFTATP